MPEAKAGVSGPRTGVPGESVRLPGRWMSARTWKSRLSTWRSRVAIWRSWLAPGAHLASTGAQRASTGAHRAGISPCSRGFIGPVRLTLLPSSLAMGESSPNIIRQAHSSVYWSFYSSLFVRVSVSLSLFIPFPRCVSAHATQCTHIYPSPFSLAPFKDFPASDQDRRI